MSKKNRIGIFGGTFDPIHIGHLIIPELIRDKIKLDKVVFIPSGNPPHKDKRKISESIHRYNMTKLAIEGNPYFEISDIELDRAGKSYTIDTLKQLHEVYKGDKLYFITGADVIWDIEDWMKPDEIFELCELVCARRPGYIEKNFTMQLEKITNKFNAVIHIVDIPLIDISSSVVRDMYINGKSIRYLVGENVIKYIIQNNLYGFNEENK